jgi:hypothetical protein
VVEPKMKMWSVLLLWSVLAVLGVCTQGYRIHSGQHPRSLSSVSLLRRGLFGFGGGKPSLPSLPSMPGMPGLGQMPDIGKLGDLMKGLGDMGKKAEKIKDEMAKARYEGSDDYKQVWIPRKLLLGP